MNQKQIILFPKGTLEPSTKAQLRKAGCIAVEVEDPNKVVMLSPSMPVGADVMTRCALNAMSGYSNSEVRARFTEYMTAYLTEQAEKQP